MHALDSCLSTGPEEKAKMMKRAYKYSSKRNFYEWVENFLKDLKEAYSPTQTANSRFVYLGLNPASHHYSSSKAGMRGDVEKMMTNALNIGDTASNFFYSNRSFVLIDHEALPRKMFGKGEMQPTD